MLRYLAHGTRDFVKWPVPPVPRLNWEFYIATFGCCAPVFPDGQSPAPRPHTLWVLPAHLTYGWKGDGKPCERVVFHFGSVPGELAESLNNQRFLAVNLSNEEIDAFKSLAQTVETHLKRPHRYSRLYFERALLDLTLVALKDHPTQSQVPLAQKASDRVERAIAWYIVNMSRNPTIEEVAQHLHISTPHLRRHFKEVKRTTPHATFRALQIRRATELLSTSADTLDVIAERCGFQSVTDFSRVFRKEMKTTADNWRKNLLEKQFSHEEKAANQSK